MAAPPGRRVRPVMGTGDVLAGRYRLDAPVGETGASGDEEPATLWRAVDDVLARPVAVKVLRALGPRESARARGFLEAAAAAGQVSSPLLARVDDAALEARPAERYGRPAGTVDVAYVVTEWVDGRTLAEVLQAGPMDPREASELTVELAEVLAEAHARGVAHGRLHPANVRVAHTGRVAVTDLGVAAALAGVTRPATAGPLPDDVVAADTRDLAALLYAMLTARWPAGATPQPSGGLAPAPGRERVYSPRQVVPGVPRAVDAAVARALDPGRHTGAAPLRTPAALTRALVNAVASDYPVRPVPQPRSPRIPPRLRRRLPLLAAVLLIASFGTATYLAGLAVGEVEPERDPFAALAEATGSPSPGAATAPAPIDLAAVPIADFDPPPGDGSERTGSIPNAVDGDATTAWETERYDSARFGGIKEGVGLLVDLGAPKPVARVELVLSRPGATVELRAADAAGATAADFPVVARGTGDGERLPLAPARPVTARYWLVWITELPEDGGRHRAGISEMVFVQP